jgi:hypothetical protein
LQTRNFTFSDFEDRPVILDEIHRLPGIFRLWEY